MGLQVQGVPNTGNHALRTGCDCKRQKGRVADGVVRHQFFGCWHTVSLMGNKRFRSSIHVCNALPPHP